ncbi:alpha-beta hydrolase superfamily lysophospholipase [Kribbella sp. VKM Ac-2527]|uniref:Alpha-beta hydrolase superfamily lysophospholipase n=1 Tax=Kribbella caucasensis TaxID=2512215 RepID=A0A4R6KCL0_9ACTN|nr:alpha/beta hydrolase [Kribbella sp. VKM Ac-2527]TDO47339.1 alpha-beta hydrolase superfamily lysophospholipase [Kribbella sp. VKM Ac-2527]
MQIRVGEIDLHVQRLSPEGPAPIVVLIHGMLYDSLASYYFTLGPAFAAAGLDVIMYDLRGHGRSTRPATGYRLEQHVDDLAGLLTALEVAQPVHLVGNSYGGSIAFGLAAAHPSLVASITAIEAEPPVQSWTQRLGDGLARAKPWLAQEETIELIREARGGHTARLSRGAAKLLQLTTIAEDVLVSRTIEEGLADLKCPVLALYGDESVLMEQVDFLKANLASCRVVVLPDQGHSVLIERTGEVSALVLDWVREQSLVEAE